MISNKGVQKSTHYFTQISTRTLCFPQAYEEAQKRLKMAEDDQKNVVGALIWVLVCPLIGHLMVMNRIML